MPLKVPRRVYDTSLSRQGAAKRAVAKGRALQARANSQSRYRQAVGMAYINPRAPTYARAAASQETKYFDTSFAANVAASADWTGTEIPAQNYIQSDGTTIGAYTDSALIPSAVGTGYGQIQGNKYLLKKIRVRGQLVATAISDAADCAFARSVRVALVMDTRPSGAQAQGEDVFSDFGTATDCNFSFMEMGQANQGRFKILGDETFMMENIVAGTDGASTNSLGFSGKQVSFTYAPKTPIPVRIKSSGSTPATSQLADCNIFLLAHSSQTTPVVNFAGCARAYFCE